MKNSLCIMSEQRKALVAKLVDAADSKSAGFKPVPVRVRPRAPSVNNEDVNLRFFILMENKKRCCHRFNVYKHQEQTCQQPEYLNRQIIARQDVYE